MDSVFDFARNEHQRLLAHFDGRIDSKTKYTMLAKVLEELGELSDAILTKDSFQRAGKLDKEVDLAGEVADVVLVTLILAVELGVDAKDALDQKMRKISARNY